ncbi:MAG TPA: hypothetical protein VMT32_01210 [Bryobacteraceae bacterium]|nr:hypothetical protein [Bryobacteraceae bacterium]
MRRVLLGTLLLLLSTASPVSMRAQDNAPAEEPLNEFFSGVVTELSGEKITVVKAVLGKNSETRTFLISANTRVEGKLRVKARVTVRYKRDEDANRALHIIVRTSQKK